LVKKKLEKAKGNQREKKVEVGLRFGNTFRGRNSMGRTAGHRPFGTNLEGRGRVLKHREAWVRGVGHQEEHFIAGGSQYEAFIEGNS